MSAVLQRDNDSSPFLQHGSVKTSFGCQLSLSEIVKLCPNICAVGVETLNSCGSASLTAIRCSRPTSDILAAQRTTLQYLECWWDVGETGPEIAECTLLTHLTVPDFFILDIASALPNLTSLRTQTQGVNSRIWKAFTESHPNLASLALESGDHESFGDDMADLTALTKLDVTCSGSYPTNRCDCRDSLLKVLRRTPSLERLKVESVSKEYFQGGWKAALVGCLSRVYYISTHRHVPSLLHTRLVFCFAQC